MAITKIFTAKDPASKAIVRDPRELASYQEMTRGGGFALSPLEIWWRDRAPFFESRGYRLRPRYRPGWEPSWPSRNLNPFKCEDALTHLIRKAMDATRVSDGITVAIKQVQTGSRETQIGLMLSTPESLSDPANHCVPILDHFSNPEEPNITYIVMPLLRQYDDPEFYDISEMLDFMSQTLEGLVYIHGRSVAHRDLSYFNIMMAGDALYPHGFHPSQQMLLPYAEGFAKPRRRRDVGYVRYYFIDFGMSKYFEDPEAPRLAFGDDGQDQEVPELHSNEMYDPFKVDIFTLGNQFKKTFLDQYANVEFISPLVSSMMNEIPERRPTAELALAQFKEIRGRIWPLRSVWRLRPKDESLFLRSFLDIHSAVRIVSVPIEHFTRHILRAFRNRFRKILARLHSLVMRRESSTPKTPQIPNSDGQ